MALLSLRVMFLRSIGNSIGGILVVSIPLYIHMRKMVCEVAPVSNSFAFHEMEESSVQLTIILWETNVEVYFLDLYFKEVLLVQEENNGGGSKEFVITYTVEQMQRFMHAVLEEREYTFENMEQGREDCRDGSSVVLPKWPLWL